jgi:hypothetical protein
MKSKMDYDFIAKELERKLVSEELSEEQLMKLSEFKDYYTNWIQGDHPEKEVPMIRSYNVSRESTLLFRVIIMHAMRTEV